jgi:hypothetical protein
MAPAIPLQQRLVAGWPELAGDLGALLDPAVARARTPGGTGLRALRLESDEITAQAMLWELAESRQQPDPGGRPWRTVAYRNMPAAAARTDICWLQHALRTLGHKLPVDGVVGPVTLRELASAVPSGLPLSPEARGELEYALEERRPAAAGRRPLAVLVRPDASVETLVSSHSGSGFDVADLYARVGFEVRTVRSLTTLRRRHPWNGSPWSTSPGGWTCAAPSRTSISPP